MLKNKLTYEIIDASTIGIDNNDGTLCVANVLLMRC
jgi:hypothetical protein